MLLGTQGLGKKVRQHIVSRTVFQDDLLIITPLLDESLMSDVYMLGTAACSIRLDKRHTALVILFNSGRRILRFTEVTEELPHPQRLPTSFA